MLPTKRHLVRRKSERIYRHCGQSIRQATKAQGIQPTIHTHYVDTRLIAMHVHHDVTYLAKPYTFVYQMIGQVDQ